jgi:hypothetical protein
MQEGNLIILEHKEGACSFYPFSSEIDCMRWLLYYSMARKMKVRLNSRS